MTERPDLDEARDARFSPMPRLRQAQAPAPDPIAARLRLGQNCRRRIEPLAVAKDICVLGISAPNV